MSQELRELKTLRHAEICEEMNYLYCQKNKKYNDSFSTTFKEYGPTALLIRIDDKVSRTKELFRDPDCDPGDETLRDTLIDLANYAIMGIMELELEEANYVTPEPPVWTEDAPGAEPEEEVAGESPQAEPKARVIKAELMDYNKDELTTIGSNLGLKLNRKSSKEDLINTIMESPLDQVELAIDLVGEAN